MIFLEKCFEFTSEIHTDVIVIQFKIKPNLLGRKKRSSDPVPSTSFDIKVSGKMNVPGMLHDKLLGFYCISSRNSSS